MIPMTDERLRDLIEHMPEDRQVYWIDDDNVPIGYIGRSNNLAGIAIELTSLRTLTNSAALIAFQDGTSIYRDGDRWRYCRDEVESESDYGSVVEAWAGLREK